MKFVLLLCAGIALAVLVTESSATPAGGTSGTGQNKPGTCNRPVYGRRRRSLDLVEEIDDEDTHSVQKRQVQAYGYPQGGSTGNNGWKPTAPPPGPGFGRPQCYRDNDCSGNKKCCSGVCQTPSFVG